ncbi:MAG: hypothetical protein QM817_20540 [Archangium sp.]
MRAEVSTAARPLGVKLDPARRFGEFTTSSAAQTESVRKLLERFDYRFTLTPNDTLQLLADWVALAKRLRRVLEGYAGFQVNAADAKALEALRKRTASTAGPVAKAMQKATWDPQIAPGFDFVNPGDRLESNDFMLALQLANARATPIAKRLKELDGLDELSRNAVGLLASGASAAQLAAIGVRAVQQCKLEAAKDVAIFDLRWSRVAQDLPKKEGALIHDALITRFIEHYEGHPRKPRGKTYKLRRAFVDQYNQALWGTDADGARELKRVIGSGLKVMTYRDAAALVMKASPY